ASESSMLLATMSFLSAFNFSFKISMLVSEAAPEVASEAAPGACCAIAGTAHQIRPARNNAISFFMITILYAKVRGGYCSIVNEDTAPGSSVDLGLLTVFSTRLSVGPTFLP